MRPLDPIGSIKTKLGILIVVTVSLASVTPTAAATVGVRARYAIPVAIVLALAVTQVLARGMTSPLREMTGAARQMARGRYDVRVTATSRDEVGELARAFNTMAADLAAVDRQRRELVANVSHELRTPISALQAVLENLVDGVATVNEETLRAALSQTGRLAQLVSDLLDLSRVEAGDVPLRREDVELRSFLDDAVEEARLNGRPVRYAVRAAPDLTLRADRARLHQLVANLLDNASRHSPVGGTVVVAAELHDRSVTIEVADEGPGISEADRTRVFERFTGGGTSDGSTGLGLAIARWVTDLHGGSIAVADTATGCRIRAEIPSEQELR